MERNGSSNASIGIGEAAVGDSGVAAVEKRNAIPNSTTIIGKPLFLLKETR